MWQNAFLVGVSVKKANEFRPKSYIQSKKNTH